MEMIFENNFRVSFLTWNIYQGFDVAPLFDPSLTPAQVPIIVTQIFRQFLATNFPVRAKAIAKAIVSEKPDLIGLQEAVRVELIIPTFGTVTYDFVEILLEELKEQGLNYAVAARNNNAEAEFPDSNGNLVHFLETDAILIRKNHKLGVIRQKANFRTNLTIPIAGQPFTLLQGWTTILETDAILTRKKHRLDVIRRQEANFQTNLTIPIAGQPFTILRGWSSIDVKIHGKVFRMVNTRLDPTAENIRNAQANEILQGPANTCLPVVITGDLNAPPNSSTINLFIEAGFEDVWDKVGKGPGLTHEQNPDLLNAISMLTERFDYIFFKNGWEPIKAELHGELQNDRTKTGLWPSDHATVSASLHLENHHDLNS